MRAIVLFLITGLLMPLLAQQGELIASVSKAGVWKFINEENEVMFGEEYRYATYFSDGVACVSKKGTRSPLNPNVLLGGEYYAVDTQGKVLKGVTSDEPFFFHEGRAVVSRGELKVIVDKMGKEIFSMPSAGNGIGRYSEGKVAVFKDRKIMFLDLDGKVVIGPDDFTTGGFSEGLAVVKLQGKLGYMDESGKVVIDYLYNNASGFSDGLAWVFKGKEAFYIAKDGTEKLGPYAAVKPFTEGIAGVAKEPGKWMYIDKSGKQLFGKTFTKMDVFSEGVAIVELPAGKVGIIDTKGKIQEVDARVAFSFKNGLSIAEKDRKMGFIDKEGKWVIPAEYDKVNDFTVVEK